MPPAAPENSPGGRSTSDLNDAVTIDRPSSGSPARSASTFGGMITSGQTLLDRYRVVVSLGRGGMGEVVRADDLELNQPVALKFLPAQVAADPMRLTMLRAEVAAARQVSHPNVCRVFDLARAETPSGPVAFLCMEFVDGSDLSTLLARIGRFSKEKANDVARQICFGLAAIHEAGLIHRDLKPANIMLDGRGRVRIADFGLAVQQAAVAGEIAGTPRYMAPEVLRGEAATRGSDIYALGLVLFELYTGRCATPEQLSVDQLVERARSGDTQPPNPSQFVDDIHPAVEQTILDCLRSDASERPASAIAVAARLPGGDPLAAALAGGQTPSPELIAAAGSRAGLPARTAVALVGAVALSVFLYVLVTSPYVLLSWATPGKSIEVLTDRARELVRAIGLPSDAPERWSGVRVRQDWLERARALPSEQRRRLIAGQPGPYLFWYRQSPVELTSSLRNYRFAAFSPYPSVPGEVVIITDGFGRLDSLVAVPSLRASGGASGAAAVVEDPEPPWIGTLFGAAGLERAKFRTAAPIRRAPVDADRVLSWVGPAYAGFVPSVSSPDPESVVVHAGLIGDAPVYFDVSPVGVEAPGVPSPPAESGVARVASGVTTTVVLIISAAMLVLTMRNLRDKRGDIRGATRIAVALALVGACSELLVYQRRPDIARIFFGGAAFGPSIWLAMLFWLFYVALEPYARRLWPHALITWSRLVAGRFRDPAVGRDVLIGLALGTALSAASWALHGAMNAMLRRAPSPSTFEVEAYLLGTRMGLVIALQGVVTAFMYTSGGLLAFVVGRLLFKSERGAELFAVLIICGSAAPALATGRAEAIAANIPIVCGGLVLVRAGMLAGFASFLAIWLVSAMPVGLNWSSPWSEPAWIPAGLIGLTALAAAAVAVRQSPDQRSG